MIVEGIDENGNNIYINKTSEIVGETLLVDAPIIPGYILNDDEQKTIEIQDSENKLVFIYTSVKYSVTYKANGGIGDDLIVSDILYKDVYVVEESMFVNDGYNFVTWNTKEDGTGEIVKPTDNLIITSDVELYAIWEESKEEYKLIFDYQDATDGNTIENKPVQYDVAIGTLPEPTKTKKEFGGWYAKPYGVGEKYTKDTIYNVKEDTIIYAKWSSISTSGDGPSGGSTNPTASPKPTSIPGSATLTVEGINSLNNVIYTKTTNETIGETLKINAPEIAGYILNDELEKSILIKEGSNKLVFNYKNESEGPVLNKGDHIAYIKGYPDQSVRPENSITRAEAAVIFYRLVVNADKTDEIGQIFPDVTQDMWFHHEVDYLAKNNIILGYVDGTFKPDEFITRAEFAVLASKFDNIVTSETNMFSDVVDTHWAIKYINSAATKGWINGFEDGTFHPDESITREQVVTLVNKMLDRKIDVEDIPDNIIKYTDLEKTHWSFAEIMEATVGHDYTRKQNGSEIWTEYDFFNDL